MRKKIQNSMLIVILITLIITFAVTTFIVYRQNMSVLTDEAKQEANYIATAINFTGSSYLEAMDEVDSDTRVTMISREGSVIYDSGRDAKSLENHSGRKEIREALKNGTGEDTRVSDTVGKMMFYYAVRLDDGNVLRISKLSHGLTLIALEILPLMIILAIVMLIFAWLISKNRTEAIVRPINCIDVEYPLDNIEYDELRPILEAIDTQNKAKDAIADMRKEFSANVSHELKTPLTSISGYAEIMKNGLVKPEDIPEFSDRIYMEACRLIVLIEDIIKLSRMDEGEVQLEKENVNLYELVLEICGRLSPQATKKNVRIDLQGEAVTFFGVKQILDEMIYNICENAVKYNKENGLVKVWVGNTLEGIKIIVDDNGIGIPKQHQDRIFERFYRVDKSHSKASGGTGLGLSIVKHAAIIHGAEISLDSEEGRGTKICILFKNQQAES